VATDRAVEEERDAVADPGLVAVDEVVVVLVADVAVLVAVPVAGLTAVFVAVVAGLAAVVAGLAAVVVVAGFAPITDVRLAAADVGAGAAAGLAPIIDVRLLAIYTLVRARGGGDAVCTPQGINYGGELASDSVSRTACVYSCFGFSCTSHRLRPLG
jgi:p-aminobenzoyl-glutamate transporter AbgT